ncbi:hypothetical protein JCGZ_08376 [Jatropha curcas]|uniref:Uncharacterized protein n=1 Tax=Jatropha curcas TaxID=180498 RepID=A0A067KIB9_JATCU|nr:hypothetical protein JCGZ_08376 [Jatropha curcas]
MSVARSLSPPSPSVSGHQTDDGGWRSIPLMPPVTSPSSFMSIRPSAATMRALPLRRDCLLCTNTILR